ncbi:MAG TPA: YdbH domain-containing protein, partial [Opitutus sp.]|nr:YdbH domain-containing protein [Opitutus sp.]
GWTLDGIILRGDLTVNLADLASMKSASPWDLNIRTISHSRFGARNLAVSVQFNEDRTVSLLSAHVEMAGGDVRVDPSTVTLFPPVLDFNLRIDRVGLQDLVALFPGSFSDAKGRIDGVVRLGWSEAAGFQVGAGRFELRDDEIATLRLTSTPGFLTDRVPERLALLPAWTGKIGQWFSPLNPVYGDVQKIELGQTELQIVSFSLELTPQGDHRDRHGVLKVNARPTAPGALVQRVTFDININGSISELIKLGMDDSAAFEVQLE